MGFFEKLKNGMSKTRENISGKLNSVFAAFTRVDEDLLEELEETLILCDMGVPTTEKVIAQLRDRIKEERIREPEEVRRALAEIIRQLVEYDAPEEKYPKIILIVGVNGVGKTTSIGKIAHVYQEEGKSVLLAAADTFRAAAAEQLTVWSEAGGCAHC